MIFFLKCNVHHLKDSPLKSQPRFVIRNIAIKTIKITYKEALINLALQINDQFMVNGQFVVI